MAELNEMSTSVGGRESKQVGVPTVNLLTHTPEEQLSPKVKAFLLRPKKLYINGQF